MWLAIVLLSALGVILGLMLGFAARWFALDDVDPMISEVQALMPGSQCGQCGFPGCSAAAVALVEGQAPVNCCPPGGRALAEKLAALLDVPLQGSDVLAEPQVASIQEASCTGCTRCFRACPTDAIVGANGQIHVVLSSACTGCGKCAEACPEHCVLLQQESISLEQWHWPKPMAAA